MEQFQQSKERKAVGTLVIARYQPQSRSQLLAYAPMKGWERYSHTSKLRLLSSKLLLPAVDTGGMTEILVRTRLINCAGGLQETFRFGIAELITRTYADDEHNIEAIPDAETAESIASDQRALLQAIDLDVPEQLAIPNYVLGQADSIEAAEGFQKAAAQALVFVNKTITLGRVKVSGS